MGSESQITLRAFYAAHFEPLFLVGCAPRTMEAYRGTLSKWERHSENVTLDKITSVVLGGWKVALVKAELTPATINKHLRHLMNLLGKAGPPGPRNRDALGLIANAAWTKPMREAEPDVHIVTEAELAAFYRACDVAESPLVDGIKTVDWWRALVVMAYTCVMRRGSLLALRWDQVDLGGRWIRYAGVSDKARRRREKRLHPVAVEHLLRIRGDRELVFAWPEGCGRFDYWFRKIAAAAGLVDGWNGGPAWTLHDLKRTAATMHSERLDAFTLQHLCDHSSIATTQRYYVRPKGRVAEAIDTMPLPAFLASGTQRLLFEA